MNIREATDQQLFVILADDPMATLADLWDAKDELERRQKPVYTREQVKIKLVYRR